MRLFRFRGADIVCSPALLAALPAAFILGRGAQAAAAFASLTLHEAAHAMTAKRAGCAVEAVELQPFGFVARLDCRRADPREAAAVYAAGPIASLCAAASCTLLSAYLPRLLALLFGAEPVFTGAAAFLRGLSDRNLVIAAVNMLPALPLDGGRLLSALLGGSQKHGLAVRLLSASGALTGAAFIAVSVLLYLNGIFNPTFLLMGGFLVFAAIREGRAARLPVRHKRLGPRDAIAVRQIAMGKEVTLASAMRMLPAGAYAVVAVLDSAHRTIASLDEAELISAAQTLGASATLANAVAYRGGKMV